MEVPINANRRQPVKTIHETIEIPKQDESVGKLIISFVKNVKLKVLENMNLDMPL
jgi:hypothetical protein